MSWAGLELELAVLMDKKKTRAHAVQTLSQRGNDSLVSLDLQCSRAFLSFLFHAMPGHGATR